MATESEKAVQEKVKAALAAEKIKAEKEAQAANQRAEAAEKARLEKEKQIAERKAELERAKRIASGTRLITNAGKAAIKQVLAKGRAETAKARHGLSSAKKLLAKATEEFNDANNRIKLVNERGGTSLHKTSTYMEEKETGNSEQNRLHNERAYSIADVKKALSRQEARRNFSMTQINNCEKTIEDCEMKAALAMSEAEERAVGIEADIQRRLQILEQTDGKNVQTTFLGI